MRFFILFFFLCTGLPLLAQSESPAPVVVYEGSTGKGDHAFITATREGIAQAKKELKIEIDEVSVTSSAEDAIRGLARKGTPLIIAAGSQFVIPVMKIAEEYPQTKFTVIDGMLPDIFGNVQSIMFNDHEGAFLVGMIAAYKSETGIVGFIGGMDIPVIRNFGYGFQQGALYANPKVKVLREMVGSNREAWNNPEKAGRLAMQMMDDGADVIFAAAGASGLGVLEAASKQHKYAIGVDTNQNDLYPGTVLTSMVKRVDKAVFNTLKSYQDGDWQPGTKYLGVRNGALDYAIDTHNKGLVSKGIIDKVETAKDLMIRGTKVVEVYSPK